MYENQTFNTIMQRMLNNVSDDIDKREGSIIYTALAPLALELETYYEALDRHSILLLFNQKSRRKKYISD